MPKTLGKFISRDYANLEINKFLEIRQYSSESVNEAVARFGGGIQKYYSDKEISFIFEKDKIMSLFELNQAKDCNGLRVYYGAAPTNSFIDDKQILMGSTTLVLVACKINYDESGNFVDADNLVAANEKAAIEYPGGATKNDLELRIDISSDRVDQINYFL